LDGLKLNEALDRFQLGAKLGVTVGDPEDDPFEVTLSLVHVLDLHKHTILRQGYKVEL
jgi:hypothetical protein